MKYFNKEVILSRSGTKKLWNQGLLKKKTKELVGVACTYMTKCPYFIEDHTKAALKAGASKQEIA